MKEGYLILSWRPFREKTTFLREDSGRPSKLQHWAGTLVRSSSLSTVTTCHCINHVTKRPTPSLDKDSEMESKACVANKFSILGFETSFTLNWSYIFSVNFCYKVRTAFFFGLILRKSTLFLRRGNKNTIVSVLRHFTCELWPCELYPVILSCERYTFISRLSSPSSLATSWYFISIILIWLILFVASVNVLKQIFRSPYCIVTCLQCSLLQSVKGLNPGVISKGWVWSSG